MYAAYAGDDKRQVQLRVKVLNRRVERVREGVGKQLREVGILELCAHVRDDFLPIPKISLLSTPACRVARQDLTSTALLLKVLHSGLGRMDGRRNGPEEYGPCGSCENVL